MEMKCSWNMPFFTIILW